MITKTTKNLQFTSCLIASMSAFILLYMSQSLYGFDEVSVLVITFMSYIPMVFFGLHSGYWCDKYPYNQVNTICASLLVLAAFAYSLIFYFETELVRIVLFAIVSFLISTSSFIYSISISANIPRNYDKSNWMKINANLSFYRSGGVITGSLLGSFFATAEFIYYSFFLFLGASVLCFYSSVKSTEQTSVRPDIEKMNIKGLFLSSFKPIIKNRALILMIGHGSLSNLVTGVIQFSLYIFLTKTLEITPQLIGILLVFRQLGGLIASKFLSHFEISVNIKYQLTFVSLFNGVLWATLALLPVTEYVSISVGILFFIISANSLIFNLIMSTFRMSAVSSEEQGRSLSAIRFILFASFPIGTVIGYLLMEFFSLRLVFLFSGVLIALTSFLILNIKVNE